MEHALILSNVAKHVILTREEEIQFLSFLQPRELDKKEILLGQSGPCSYINFVNKGTLRAFYTDDNAKEYTVMFAIQDWWITDINAFANQTLSSVTIQALEDSQIFQLGNMPKQELLKAIPKFERYFRILMQNAYIREQSRSLRNISQSAEERYHHFISKYPGIAAQITLKQLASYLGITPEFLSALRARH